jgi:hypothetical protein
LVVVLFVLSALAPREWRSIAIAPVARPAGGEQNVGVLASPTRIAERGERQRANFRPTAERTATAESARVPKDEGEPGGSGDQVPAEGASGLQASSDTALPASETSSAAEPAAELSQIASALEEFPAIASGLDEINLPIARQSIPYTVLDEVAPPSFDIDKADASPQAEITARQAVEESAPARRVLTPDVQRSLSDSATPVITHWPYPATLARTLQTLAHQEACQAWCREVLVNLNALSENESLSTKAVDASLAALRELADKASVRASAAEAPALRSDWARAVHALTRRLTLWEQISKIASEQRFLVSFSLGDSEHLDDVIDAVDAMLSRVRHGAHWKAYLLLDEAKRHSGRAGGVDTAECRDWAKRVLLRTDYSVLDPSHHAFLAQLELAGYIQECRQLASEPVDYLRLLDELERFETDKAESHALHVAAAQHVLRWSRDEHVAELGRRLDANYRNANLRIAASRGLLERLLPAPDVVAEPVDDYILGVWTWGRSKTRIELGVTLLPSSQFWRLGLTAQGRVAAETYSSRGPATFQSLGQSEFQAEKEVVIHHYGYYHRPAEASAESVAQLAGLETEIDAVPFIGAIAQIVAAQGFESQTPAAQSEMDDRVTSMITHHMDEEVSRALKEVQANFTKHFYQPMEKLALSPIAMEMQTTERHLVARYRLAGVHQLAAHTPRPISPDDSVFSLQVHESALNNFVEQLGWEGRRVNLCDLVREMGQLFQHPSLKVSDEFPDDVTVRFAPEEPLRFSFQDGKVTVKLSLAELSQGRNQWRDFTVRVHYRHDREKPDADLIRDSYIELSGKRLKFGDQIALRAIFSRVFALNQPVAIISKRLKQDPRLAGLRLNQMAIGDGWLAASVGPQESRGNLRISALSKR